MLASKRFWISRDVYVLDITMNFMLNKRKSKKAGELSALPPNPLAVTGVGTPPPPVVNIFIRLPLSQNPGSAPEYMLARVGRPLHRSRSVILWIPADKPGDSRARRTRCGWCGFWPHQLSVPKWACLICGRV